MAYANTIYLDNHETDYYDHMYEIVSHLNGDYEPIPYSIESFFGQNLNIRDDNGKLKTSIKVINLGKDTKEYKLNDNYSPYLYLNYITIMCWLNYTITRTPASIQHLSVGLDVLNTISLSEKAFKSESSFSKEIGIQLSNIIESNKTDQRVWIAVRSFANYAIETGFWGFDENLIFKLDEIKILGHGKKTRVSLLDHEYGPFTRTEISDITQAIHQENISLKERVMVKLAMKYGLRPIQLALLREKDVFYDKNKLAWYINIPRVKGRVAQLRRNINNFILRELNEDLAKEISTLIEDNMQYPCADKNQKKLPRPLFIRKTVDSLYLEHDKTRDYAWHNSSFKITNIFRHLKLNIFSKHVKGEDDKPVLLRLNCYRFRYTLGTRMVMEGKTPDEVALALDHSTTASVRHYFKYNRDIIDFIDDSFESSTVLKNATLRWKGFLIDEDDDTIAGTIIRVSDIVSLGKCLKKSSCKFHPTVSCYGCAKFRPYKDADHEAQLKVIEAEVDFVKQNSSGPVQHQLDEALQGAIEIIAAQKAIKEGK
jgi:integrase